MSNELTPVLDVYSRQGCHLCELLVEELLPIARGKAKVRVHDVDTREEWSREYGLRVPVVELNGTCLCEFELDRAAVIAALNRP
ncbi:MAG TPA: glutaredoxin family protein [Woeseiaceae bacterium]